MPSQLLVNSQRARHPLPCSVEGRKLQRNAGAVVPAAPRPRSGLMKRTRAGLLSLTDPYEIGAYYWVQPGQVIRQTIPGTAALDLISQEFGRVVCWQRQ